MKKLFLLSISVFITFSFSLAQGIIRGKVSDKTGETLIGVTIVLKSNHSVGTITDLDGNYSLKITDSTEQTLIVSYVSYQSVETTVHPVKGEIILKDFVLESASKDLGVIEVTAKATRAKDYFMENLKKNSSTTIDYISAETIKKTGDPNVTAAVARVSGVSTNGSFITIRGIGDRYVKTTINGLRIPTLDPFTNNIRLDMFPSSLVDNVIVSKTASPDLPGDWAGAYLSVETKDYPDKLSVNIESSIGYNNQTTFKNVLSSQHSSTDWLGYDNGFRERNHTDFKGAILTPTQYQQFVALGLGDYYKSIGITGWIDDGSLTADLYFKLGLVKLGLLTNSQFDDPAAVNNAKTLYIQGSYKDQAFNKLNADAAKTGQSFPNNWNTTIRKAPFDFTQSFSVGDQFTINGKAVGVLAGFRYGSATLYDSKSIAQRPYPVTGLLEKSIEQQITKETNGWSALLNLAYKFNPNNSITFIYMPNLNGVNNVRNSNNIIANNQTKVQFYEDRKQLVYQLKTEHYLPTFKTKIDFNASYTDGKSNAPDFKILQYDIGTSSSPITIDPTNQPADRYYRYLTDKLFDSKLSAEMPIGSKSELSRKLKFGGAYLNDHQKSDQYHYHLNYGNSASLIQSTDIDQVMSLDNFDIQNNSIVWIYSQDIMPVNHTFGRTSITSGFALLDYAITRTLRVSGGLRVEHAVIFTDIDEYNALGYMADDGRRFYGNGGFPIANPGKLNEINYLPSLNIIYKLKNIEESPINVRLNFSQTVARPSIRELSDVTNYDYELQATVLGNPNLKTVHINNYDLRLESYFKNGDNLSVSLFYKDFKNHIELVNSTYYYWQNVDKSKVVGIELEGKKAITKHLEFRANTTFDNSTSKFVRSTLYVTNGIINYIPVDTIKRPMFGQAPYIINGMLSYNADSIGLVVTLSYNLQGPRLVIASDNKSIPDVYELQRHLLDFKTSKKFGKHFTASITIRNILNEPIRRSYKYPEGYTMDFDKYRYGTNFLLSILYKL